MNTYTIVNVALTEKDTCFIDHNVTHTFSMRKAAAENRLTMNVLHIMEEIPVGKERKNT